MSQTGFFSCENYAIKPPLFLGEFRAWFSAQKLSSFPLAAALDSGY
jgi:hypothetical protein